MRPLTEITARFLLERVTSLAVTGRTALVAIDGRGGSGKSTLTELVRATDRVAVVEFDDFYRPSGERQLAPVPEEYGFSHDWRRLRDQVLIPLSVRRRASYQRYDWKLDELAEWHEIAPEGVVIVDGIYTLRPQLRTYYDYTVWVECEPIEIRLARALQRDGADMQDVWLNEWMPDEDRYVNEARPAEIADLVVDGTRPARLPCD